MSGFFLAVVLCLLWIAGWIVFSNLRRTDARRRLEAEAADPVKQQLFREATEAYWAEMNALWPYRRGMTGRPTLWACSGCGYSFWSNGDSQDPEGDGHCSKGRWFADHRALDVAVGA